MKYPNKFSYGQLFAFSGLDGESTQTRDFIGVLQNKAIRIRFHLPEWIELRLDVPDSTRFDVVLGDTVESTEAGAKVVFTNKDTVAGYALLLPTVQTEKGATKTTKSSSQNGKVIQESVITTDAGDVAVLRTWSSEHGYSFTFSWGVQDTPIYEEKEIDEIVRARKAYYEDKPK